MALDVNSEGLLTQTDQRLASVLRLASERTPFAWRITQSARTIEQQREYFKGGKSKVNPDAYSTPAELYKAAKHITGPGMPLSRAVDVCIVGSDPYHVPSLCYLAGVIRSVAMEQGVKIRQGCDFDGDGKLMESGTFIDLPHHELAQDLQPMPRR